MQNDPTSVQVAFLPSLIDREAIASRVAVVIDVLRATTTIVEALANGASGITPCREIDEARQLAASAGMLLGGERQGSLIEGFDLDNSPYSYGSSAVAGRDIAFTTTNGTGAIAAAANADRVLIGAFVNRLAVVQELRRLGKPVILVCAGTDGHVTAEDVLFAGGVAYELMSDPSPQPGARFDVAEIEAMESLAPSEATELAIDFHRDWGCNSAKRLEALRQSRGGRNLLELGHSRDIDRAAQDSIWNLVPAWDRTTGRVTVPGMISRISSSSPPEPGR